MAPKVSATSEERVEDTGNDLTRVKPDEKQVGYFAPDSRRVSPLFGNFVAVQQLHS
jgi:hypothetical protein